MNFYKSIYIKNIILLFFNYFIHHLLRLGLILMDLIEIYHFNFTFIFIILIVFLFKMFLIVYLLIIYYFYFYLF